VVEHGLVLPRCRRCGSSLFYSGVRRGWFCYLCDTPKQSGKVHFG
jgi:hypothetical protein